MYINGDFQAIELRQVCVTLGLDYDLRAYYSMKIVLSFKESGLTCNSLQVAFDLP